MRQKYTLFTNLTYVTIGDVRTNCAALLLEEAESAFDRDKPQCKIRGFGPDPAWPVFDIFLKVPTIEFELQDAASHHAIVLGQNGPYPLSVGAILTIRDGLRMELIAQNRALGLLRDDFEGEQEERTILKVWDVLSRRCIEAWNAPNMPMLTWRPTGFMQRAIG